MFAATIGILASRNRTGPPVIPPNGPGYQVITFDESGSPVANGAISNFYMPTHAVSFTTGQSMNVATVTDEADANFDSPLPSAASTQGGLFGWTRGDFIFTIAAARRVTRIRALYQKGSAVENLELDADGALASTLLFSSSFTDSWQTMDITLPEGELTSRSITKFRFINPYDTRIALDRIEMWMQTGWV